MSNFYIKTNRIFTPLRKWSWLFILVVAFGGLWYPKLGLLMIPVMIALPVMGFAKGNYWCGNICPHGSLFDRFIFKIGSNKGIPSWAKSKITITLAFAWFMFMLGQRLMKVFAIWGTTAFIDKLGYIFVINYFMVTILGTTLALLISPRTWCNFCPMSTVQKLFYKLGKTLGLNKSSDRKVTVAHPDMCHSCGKCSRVCPMQLKPYLEFSDKNQFDNEVCIRCSTCVENCPANILSLDNEEKALAISASTNLDGYENRRYIKGKVVEIKDMGNDIKEFNINFIEPKKVEYKAGQFILIKIQDVPEMYRAYSISTEGNDGTGVRITVKKVPDGYGTDMIFSNVKEGDIVTLQGPMGRELIVDKSAKEAIFVAGGIGITPFVPMVEDVVKNDNTLEKVTLIYGVNKENEFLYDEFFTEMAKTSGKFEYVKVVAFDEKWQGKKGFVTDVLKDMDLSNTKIYMCGPLPMTNATLKVLDKMGVAQDNIYYESA